MTEPCVNDGKDIGGDEYGERKTGRMIRLIEEWDMM